MSKTYNLLPQYSTLVDLLQWRAQNQPEETAYTFLIDGEIQEISLTYEELDWQARIIAAQLSRLHATGERVILLYPSGLDFIAAFFGCLYAGAIAVPTYPPDLMRLERTLPRFFAIIRDSRPKVILTTESISVAAHSLLEQYPELADIQWVSSDSLPIQSAYTWRRPEISNQTLAFLQYTSGSTSEPKGVMLSHENLLYNSEMIQVAFEHTQHSTFVGWEPLYHDLGLIGNVLQPLYIGARGILMSPLHFLQRPYRWLKTISHYRARTSGGPNFGYELCTRKITPGQRAELDLSCWEIAFNGAEPVRHQTLELFTETFEPCGFRHEAFYPCYGLAEASVFVSGGFKTKPPVTLNMRYNALEQGRVISMDQGGPEVYTIVGCGRSWLDQEIKIMDPNTHLPCAPDQIGEIWVMGPNIAQGYWQRSDETLQTFGAHVADSGEGPYLRTGDLGFIINGELFIAGRIKDLIIIDGLNHYPQDIELTVETSHPALRPGCSAAFSIDREGAERLIIVAEVRDQKNLEKIGIPGFEEKELKRVIKRAVSENHDLRVYDIVLLKARTVHKTSSGKIQRHACKAGYLSESLEIWKA